MGAQSRNEKSITELLKDLRDELIDLIREEIALAKAEFSEKTHHIAKSGALIGAGVATAYFGAFALTAAACTGLAAGFIAGGMPMYIAVWLAPLIVGIAFTLVGGAVMAAAAKSLRKQRLTPRKTIQTFTEAA